MTATDADALEYTLGGTDMPSFGIVTASGQLQTEVTLDYEDKSSYEVTVTATDPVRSNRYDHRDHHRDQCERGWDGDAVFDPTPRVGSALTASSGSDPDGAPSSVYLAVGQKGDFSQNGTFTNLTSGATILPPTRP